MRARRATSSIHSVTARCRARGRAGARAASTRPRRRNCRRRGRRRPTAAKWHGVGFGAIRAPLSQVRARPTDAPIARDRKERSCSTRCTVDVVSDVVCPWCYIGKRRLEAALAQAARGRARPDRRRALASVPAQSGLAARKASSRRGYLEAKFGGPQRAQADLCAGARRRDVRRTSRSTFDAIERQPNTLDAHRLIAWAQTRPEGDADALVEAPVSRLLPRRTLRRRPRRARARCAQEAGFDRRRRARDVARVGADACGGAPRPTTRARGLGITGVPFFIFDGKTGAVRGAGTRSILDAIAQAARAGAQGGRRRAQRVAPSGGEARRRSGPGSSVLSLASAVPGRARARPAHRRVGDRREQPAAAAATFGRR